MADALEAVEDANRRDGDHQRVSLRLVPVAGHQYFEGNVDRRPRCRRCREPIELDDPDNPESWIHAEDANCWGDHTADLGPSDEATPARRPELITAPGPRPAKLVRNRGVR